MFQAVVPISRTAFRSPRSRFGPLSALSKPAPSSSTTAHYSGPAAPGKYTTQTFDTISDEQSLESTKYAYDEGGLGRDLVGYEPDLTVNSALKSPRDIDRPRLLHMATHKSATQQESMGRWNDLMMAAVKNNKETEFSNEV